MNINNPPVFDQIVDTGGVIIKPTVYSVDGTHQNVTWNVLRPMLEKVVDIGPWDMDNVVTLNVTHGIDTSLYNIMEVIAHLRRDSDDRFATLSTGYASTNTGIRDLNHFSPDNNTIRLQRLTGGDFDSINYTSTAFSRGKLLIRYRLI